MSARFENAGLRAFWPYCAAARQLKSAVLEESAFTTLEWRRRLEAFGPDDGAVVASGPGGELDGGVRHGHAHRPRPRLDVRAGPGACAGCTSTACSSTIRSTSFLYLRSTPVAPGARVAAADLHGPLPGGNKSGRVPAAHHVHQGAAGRNAVGGTPRRRGQTAACSSESPVVLDIPIWGTARALGPCRGPSPRGRLTAGNGSQEMQYLNALWGKWMPADSPARCRRLASAA